MSLERDPVAGGGLTARADATAVGVVNDPVAALLDETGLPRWDALPEELCCPRCAYNLRMLEQARCPECGFEFEWRELLEAQRRSREWLFEHAWRRRPFGSLIATLWAALWPWTFWKRMSASDRVAVGPLWFLLLLTVIGWAVLVHAQFAAVNVLQYGYWIGWGGVFGGVPITAGVVFAMVLVWMSVLLSLRQTLARGAVRAAQILRIVTYSLPAVLVGELLLFETVRFGTGAMAKSDAFGFATLILGPALPAIAFAPGWAYLKLQHGVAVGVLTVMLAVLASVTPWLAYFFLLQR